jgi:hypothetical protein
MIRSEFYLFILSFIKDLNKIVKGIMALQEIAPFPPTKLIYVDFLKSRWKYCNFRQPKATDEKNSSFWNCGGCVGKEYMEELISSLG